jgi:Zinc knuckle
MPPALSDKEKAKLVGKCYLCKEPGHMARNCFQGNKVGSSTGKPPGMSNINIKFDAKVKILESLPLGMMDIESRGVTNNWRADYLDWDQLGA